jgi:hypothetical protein
MVVDSHDILHNLLRRGAVSHKRRVCASAGWPSIGMYQVSNLRNYTTNARLAGVLLPSCCGSFVTISVHLYPSVPGRPCMPVLCS